MANRFAGLLLATGLLLAAGGVAAQAYKWRDAEGKLHFSATPPPGGKAEKLDIKPAVPEDPEAIKRGRELKAQREEAAFVREQAKQKEAIAASQKAESRCASARRNLDALSRQRPVYHLGKDGQRHYLEDKDRALETQRLQAQVNQYCR